MSSVFFIGIGGAGMSHLAILAKNLGWKVSGSDIQKNSNTIILQKKGVKFFLGHSPKNIKRAKPDLVVYSSAISLDNMDLQEAQELNISLMTRAKFLAQLTNHNKTIAVAGTHGKTTTTSMIGFILQRAGKSAYAYLGGEDKCLRNKVIRKNTWIVIETDESDKSFLYFKPTIAVVTNIDKDHLSNYNYSFNSLKTAFKQFLNGGKERKWTIICNDNKTLVSVAKKVKIKHLLTYSANTRNISTLKITKITPQLKGTKVEIIIKGYKRPFQAILPIWGEKYLLDALAAILTASRIGVSVRKSLNILQKYHLPHRRREVVGKVKNILLIDDHADHPTEIKSTLESLQIYKPQRKIIAIYQPHRYTRMKILGEKVGIAFKEADIIISTKIYPAFEKPIPNINGRKVFQWIKHQNPEKQVYYIPDITKVPSFLTTKLSTQLSTGSWILITLGPGSIKHLAPIILSNLKRYFKS